MRYRIATRATDDNRYVAAVKMRLIGTYWITIKEYSTRPDPSDADMDYARLCADELLDKLQANDDL